MTPSPSPGGRRRHNREQARLFDNLAPEFDEPVPPDVLERLEQVVAASDLSSGEAVLDVGTGTGVLLPFILARHPSRVVACDLSRQMLARARAAFRGRVRLFQRDVVDLASRVDPVDVVFCNACFGNFYDPQEALEAINSLCNSGARLVISHPMGKEFVRRLREEQPEVVTAELPERPQIEATLEVAGFRLERFQDEPELYLAVGRKVADVKRQAEEDSRNLFG